MIRAARRAGRAATSAAAGLAAAAVLVALTAGTPWLMWHVTGWPLPRHLPTLSTLKAGIAGQESARFILALVTCAGWMIWLVFITEVILEAAWWARQLPALARGPAGHPGATWLRERAAAVSPPRAVATILVGGILLCLLAALRGTGAALTIPATPRLAAVSQQATAAARPHPAREGDRLALPHRRTAAAAGNVAASGHAPAGAAAWTALAGGRMVRLDAALHPDLDQAASPAYTLYTVQPGDNLWDIALTHLGNGEDWHQIYALNAGLPQPDGERLGLPSLIQPGWILRLPAPAPASAPSGNGHLTRPPTPVMPAAGPVPGCAPSPLPSPAHRLSPAPVPHHTQPDDGNAVAIPWGGLVGAGLAGAVTGALVLAGIQRRRRYQPARILTSDLEPAAVPEPVIAVLRRAGRAAATPGRSGASAGLADTEEESLPDSRSGDGLAPVVAEGSQSSLRPQSLPPGVITLGLRDGTETAVDVAGLGGLGLTGPGAPAAARAILLGLLTQRAAAATAVVVVPGADAEALVPGRDIHSGIATGAVPRLVVTSTMAGALDQLESAVLTRARMTGTGSDSEDDLSTAILDSEAQLGTTALIATPDTAASGRLAAILQLGRGLGVTAILLGEWAGGVTCYVGADGYVTATGSQASGLAGMQMFHLAAGDATAILATLEAASDVPLTGAQDGDDEVPAMPDSAAAPSGLPDAGDRPGSGEHASGPAVRPEPGEELAGAAPGGMAPSPVTGAQPPGTVVRVQLLGPPRITVGGSEITGGLRKARELVAYLAVHSDGASGDAVSEALWPEAPRGYGTGQRNNAVRKLREQLRSVTGLDQPMFVTLANDRYRLDAALFDIDLWRFQRALDQARRAGDGDARLAAWQEAVSLYQGPLADGAGYEWAEPYAEQARRRALDACTTIAEVLAPRDPEEALAVLETAIGCDPYNEFVYQKVMRLQAAAARPDAVRRTLSLLEARLSDLGVTPGPQTRSLAASLLGVAAAPAAGADPAPARSRSRS